MEVFSEDVTLGVSSQYQDQWEENGVSVLGRNSVKTLKEKGTQCVWRILKAIVYGPW